MQEVHYPQQNNYIQGGQNLYVRLSLVINAFKQKAGIGCLGTFYLF